MNIKSLNANGATGALTVLTLILGSASWMVARSQQSVPQNDNPTSVFNAGQKKIANPTEVPILFTSRMDDRNAQAWLASEPTQSIDLPITGVSTMSWLPDYSGVLAVVGRNPMMLYPYDKQTHTFGIPKRVDEHFALKGVKYNIPLLSYQDFAPSPDQKNLVYGDEKGVHLFDLQTGAERVLVPRGQINGLDDAPSYFAWSSDGKQIAFSVEGNDQLGLQEVDQVEELYTVDADGTKLHHVGQGFSASWSPDKSSIVAIYGAANGGKQLVRFNLQSGKCDVLATTKLDLFHFVSYSPDGKQLAIIGGVKPDDYKGSLYLANSDGKIERVLVPYNKMPPIALGNSGSRADW